MPVYICQAGSNSSEPWRHGLQVYAAPFQLTDLPSGDPRDGVDNVCTLAPRTMSSTNFAVQTQHNNNAMNFNNDPRRQFSANDPDRSNNTNRENLNVQPMRFGVPVRRIRHAEVVLVDDVCIAYDRHWLRLRWPGSKGGFAGYVALGKVDEESVSRQALDKMLQARGMSTALFLRVSFRYFGTSLWIYMINYFVAIIMNPNVHAPKPLTHRSYLLFVWLSIHLLLLCEM